MAPYMQVFFHIPNIQVVITHASHVCRQHSLGLPLRMTGMHRMEFDHSCLDLLSLVIWSCVFWPSITWNLCKVQRWSKSVLTFDHYRPHYVMFPNFHFNNDKNKERSKAILVLILLYKKTTLILKTAEWIYYNGSSCEWTPLGCEKGVHV